MKQFKQLRSDILEAKKMKVKGNIIIGILLFSIIAWATGLAKFNGIASSPPPMTYLFDFDLSGYEMMALFHNYLTPKEIKKRNYRH